MPSTVPLFHCFTCGCDADVDLLALPCRLWCAAMLAAAPLQHVAESCSAVRQLQRDAPGLCGCPTLAGNSGCRSCPGSAFGCASLCQGLCDWLSVGIMFTSNLGWPGWALSLNGSLQITSVKSRNVC